MWVWWSALLISLLIVIAALWRYASRRLVWRLRRLNAGLARLMHRRRYRPAAAKKLLRQIYLLISEALDKGDYKIAYEALDLIKLALGQGFGRINDSARLTAIVAKSLKLKEFTLAGHGVDAFWPLVRQAQPQDVPQITDQLGIIAIIALKERQNFLAARAVDIIFDSVDKLDRVNSMNNINNTLDAVDGREELIILSLRSLKTIGIMVLRRKDIELFREICTKFSNWVASKKTAAVDGSLLAGVLVNWLHRIVKSGFSSAFHMLSEQIEVMIITGKLDSTAARQLIEECRHLAGIASLNPQNPAAGMILEFMLKLAGHYENISLWVQAVRSGGEVVKLAVSRYGVQEAFAVVYPLLETGRRLLLTQTKKGSSVISHVYGQQALYVIVRECLHVVEYIARQSFLLTAGDVIGDMCDCWVRYPAAAGSEKSCKKYCQLLLFYWTRTRRPLAASNAGTLSAGTSGLLSDADKERLKFLF